MGKNNLTKEQQSTYDKIKYQKNKEAIKARTRAYYYANHSTELARKRKYYADNREERLLKSKQWANEHPIRHKSGQWKLSIYNKYGITPEQFNNLLNTQNGACAICGKKPQEGKRLCIDHDHKTGMVRGLLCRNCNAAIGQLDDDTNMLSRAIAYLTRK